MKDEPEIVKTLREEELKGKLQQQTILSIKTSEKQSNNGLDYGKDDGFKYKNETKSFLRISTGAKETLRVLINLMVDPVVIVDKKGKFLEISDKVEVMTGVKKEELIGMNFIKTNFITAKSKAILVKNLAKRMLGEILDTYEIEAISKDGKIWQLQVKGIKIEYDNKPADLVVFHDVSKQKKMEEALRESKEQFQKLAENTAAGIIIIKDTKIYYVNPSIERITGYSREEMQGISFLDLVHPDSRNIVKEEISALEKKEGASLGGEIKIITKEGKECWINYVGTFIVLEGKPALMITSFDINQRRIVEDKLKEKIDELEKFQKVTIDREIMMINLKKEINELCKKYGEKSRYVIE
ncbi:MAG: PAS domain-containing protein [Thermoplasmatota archaeon]|jgi:PAS domain S-box-containing protein